MLVFSTRSIRWFCMSAFLSRGPRGRGPSSPGTKADRRPRLASPSMLASPASDGGVVAAQEDLGDRTPAELARAGVLGIFEPAVGPERLVDRAFGVAQDAGQQ